MLQYVPREHVRDYKMKEVDQGRRRSVVGVDIKLLAEHFGSDNKLKVRNIYGHYTRQINGEWRHAGCNSFYCQAGPSAPMFGKQRDVKTTLFPFTSENIITAVFVFLLLASTKTFGI